MFDVMLDLETLGTKPGCVILSVGAVFFNSDKNELGDQFYGVIDMASAMATGLKVDADTLQWWLKQGVDAQRVFSDPSRTDINVVLDNFGKYLNIYSTVATVRVWGNGADFDNVLLAEAYRKIGRKQPWGPFNGRCHRTLKGLFPHIKADRSTGTKHNALDDAVAQAKQAMACLRQLGDPCLAI